MHDVGNRGQGIWAYPGDDPLMPLRAAKRFEIIGPDGQKDEDEDEDETSQDN